MDRDHGRMPIAAGNESSFFLCNGTVWATGNNSKGRLGVGEDYIFCHKPTQVAIESYIISVAAFGDFALLLDDNGRVYKFGTIYPEDKPIPIPEIIENVPIIVAIFVRHNGYFLIDCENSLWICGNSSHGALGKLTNFDQYIPMQILPELINIQQVSSGMYHSLFLDTDGRVWSCGDSQHGRLGQGIQRGSDRKILPIQNIPPMCMVSAGYDHSMFLDVDGRVWLCGWNFRRDKNRSELYYPEMVEEIFGIVLIHAAATACFAVDEDGYVYHMGTSYNLNGESSDGKTFLPVTQFTNIEYIASGLWHVLFVEESGTVWSYGENKSAQLGLGHCKQVEDAEQITLLPPVGVSISRTKSARTH